MQTAFSTARVRPPRVTLLPLVHAPGPALVSLRPRESLRRTGVNGTRVDADASKGRGEPGLQLLAAQKGLARGGGGTPTGCSRTHGAQPSLL
jgi:hypothetical protein